MCSHSNTHAKRKTSKYFGLNVFLSLTQFHRATLYQPNECVTSGICFLLRSKVTHRERERIFNNSDFLNTNKKLFLLLFSDRCEKSLDQNKKKIKWLKNISKGN